VRILLIWLVAASTAANALPAPLDARRAAIDRALDFLYRSASDDAIFSRQGFDLLWAFYSISHTASDRKLREAAQRDGHELALRWRRSRQHVPADAGAEDIYQLVMGSYAADRLGVPDPRLKAELQLAAAKFSARDYLGFDAAHEPPRLDDPNRYDVWSGALIRSYMGDAYGVTLGAHYRDVVQWLPRLRSYDGHDEDMEFDIFYAITHVIYTLNHYNERRIAGSLLPDEIAFLRRKLKAAIVDEDPEMVGEALDCLKAAGFERDPQVKDGVKFLISTQLPDGAWADSDDGGYTAYHSAWTGIDGLRDYHFRGKVEKLPN
jgi:hypothetical protein